MSRMVNISSRISYNRYSTETQAKVYSLSNLTLFTPYLLKRSMIGLIELIFQLFTKEFTQTYLHPLNNCRCYKVGLSPNLEHTDKKGRKHET